MFFSMLFHIFFPMNMCSCQAWEENPTVSMTARYGTGMLVR